MEAGASTSGRRGPLLLYLLIAAPLLAGLFAWQGASHWEYSEGVYAYTARALGDGAALYDEVAAAQPPPLFLVGAGVLGVADSIEGLRAALSLLALVSGGLVALAVWRLTHRRVPAAAAGAASLLAPWTLREHTVFVPESFAAPLLMAAALLAGGRRGSAAAGTAAALAGCFKLAYLVPAAALALVAGDRRSYALGAGGTFALVAAASLAGYGWPLVENVVLAQGEVGSQSLGTVARLGAQAAWNAGPLLALALLAWSRRYRSDDPALLRRLAVLTAAAAALVATVVKDGSYLNVLVPLEPPAIALAAAGLTWVLRRGQRRAGPADAPASSAPAAAGTPREAGTSRPEVSGGRALRAGATGLVALLAAQSISLLLSPDEPRPFIRPFSAPAHGRMLSESEVDREVARARACPPGAAYSGEPFVAFVARRRMRGGQPDQFIVAEAARHEPFRRKVAADAVRCP